MDNALKPLPKTNEKREVSAAGASGIKYTDSALDDLAVSATGGSNFKPLRIVKPMICPCCKQAVTLPTVELVVDHYRVTPLEARILGAVWRGKGMPVVTERIFDAMYADDPDGGPTPARMYAAFKVALCHLREKLQGSGLGIENVGYRRGYRLVMEMKG
jgi:hypothetical protein